MMASAAPDDEPQRTMSIERVERVLAFSRAFLTVTAFIAIVVDPSEPVRLRAVTYAVLLAYALYSLAVWAGVHLSSRLTSRHARVLHGFDVLWTSALTFVSQGPISPFFLFFLFVVLASAYRWGFRQTFGTALVTIGVFLVETAVAAAGPWKATWFASMAFDLNGTILHVAYLLLTGVLLGYLAEQDKAARLELATLAAAARQPRVNLGLGGSVTSLGRTLLSVFDARSLAIAVREDDTERTTLWEMEVTAASNDPLVRRTELDSEAARHWLFPDPGSTWWAAPSRDAADAAAVQVAEPGVWRLSRGWRILPASVTGAPPRGTVTAVNMGFEGEWHARAYLFGLPERALEQRLHFLRALADHATPALTNVILLRRLRARASAAERARVARELHDGAIQSLFAIDMRLEAMRRAGGASAALQSGIEDVQVMVRQEVVALRELMQALRPVDVDSSDQLPEALGTVVERFQRESGIAARFVFAGSRITLPSATAVELVRITQEALVNVRKHSAAGNVLVRLTTTGDGCQLVVEDDGRGFTFEGRFTASDLARRRLGPMIIQERARLVGADLAVESTPGAGARVEVTVPVATHG